MSALDSLIRVHRWQLDERRRHLTSLEELKDGLRQDCVRLQQEAATEAQLAGRSSELGSVYPFYVRLIIERQRKIENSILEVEIQITEARDAVADAFQEVKRYELAAANRARAQQNRLGRRLQQDQDALAIEIFRRKNSG